MELLNDILSTVKEEYLCGTLPDLDVDAFEYDVDKSECTEIYTILSGFKHFRKDSFSSPNGLIACLEKYFLKEWNLCVQNGCRGLLHSD